MTLPEVRRIEKADHAYPQQLIQRLGNKAPVTLFARGNLSVLETRKLALFCSSRCPGRIILETYDLAQSWRDQGITVVSGFHSPAEKECLRILLRGAQPLLLCPARKLEGMRIPVAWRVPLEEGRLLFLSPFAGTQDRVTSALAQRRNELVAALADEAHIAYATPGGRLEKLAQRIAAWGISEE